MVLEYFYEDRNWVKSDMNPSEVCQILFGISLRIKRKEFSILVQEIMKGLWCGKACKSIEDARYLNSCVSYIKRYQPDNAKIRNNGKKRTVCVFLDGWHEQAVSNQM